MWLYNVGPITPKASLLLDHHFIYRFVLMFLQWDIYCYRPLSQRCNNTGVNSCNSLVIRGLYQCPLFTSWDTPLLVPITPLRWRPIACIWVRGEVKGVARTTSETTLRQSFTLESHGHEAHAYSVCPLRCAISSFNISIRLLMNQSPVTTR